MTNLCDSCETCTHCAKHGCIPVSGDAPVAAHRVVCDGAEAPAEPVAKVVSKYGDPEAFGEREIKVLIDIQKLPYGTKFYLAPSPIPVVEAGPDVIESVSHALRKAYQLGQTYWRQADSESSSQHRKADETHEKFKALVDEISKALSEKLTEAPK